MKVLRAQLRKITPLTVRRLLARQSRSWRDRRAAIVFAGAGPKPAGGFAIVSVTQPILKTSGSMAKVHNLHLALARIGPVLLIPESTFSFWRAVGPPRASRGFQKGRNIMNGVLGSDYGGGLCQLAGLLYHLSLLGQLTITERHAHSRDLYRENERYTPLGADATVVFGYKDLRVRNERPDPVWFTFELTEESLRASLWSTTTYSSAELRFERVADEASHARVHTWRDDQLVAVSEYLREGDRSSGSGDQTETITW